MINFFSWMIAIRWCSFDVLSPTPATTTKTTWRWSSRLLSRQRSGFCLVTARTPASFNVVPGCTWRTHRSSWLSIKLRQRGIKHGKRTEQVSSRLVFRKYSSSSGLKKIRQDVWPDLEEECTYGVRRVMGRADNSTELKLWCFCSAECGFESRSWHLCSWARHLTIIASLHPGVNGYLLGQRWFLWLI